MRLYFILAYLVWQHETLCSASHAAPPEEADQETPRRKHEQECIPQEKYPRDASFNGKQSSCPSAKYVLSSEETGVKSQQKSTTHSSPTSTSTSTSTSSNGSSCQLYMAESSIPFSGLGLYTTSSLKQGQTISFPEIVLSLYDYEYNMKMIAMFTEAEMAEWTQVVGNRTDNNEACLSWTKMGECDSNPTFMMEQCAKSCAVTKAGLDVDKVMMNEFDSDDECGSFADHGACETSQSWMNINCPESCLAEKFHFQKYLDVDIMPWIVGDYTWSSYTSHTGHEAYESIPVIPGLGAAVNSHLGLVNMKAIRPTVDSAGGHHRSKDVGVGAFSDRYNFTFQAKEDIPAGMELFADYGDGYFLGREATYGPVPLGDDYQEADDILAKFWNGVELHVDGEKTKNNANAEAKYENIMASILAKFWNDAEEVEKGEYIFNENANAKAKYEDTLDSIAKPKVRMVMPKTFEEAIAGKGSSTAMLSVPNVIRSQSWLSENGMCVDNMYPGQSSIPQAGRGAFASRTLNAGQLISPMPLLPMNREFLRSFKNEREMNQLLIHNYMFGHEKSSVTLLPYSPIVNFVNNHFDKSKVNARVQWSASKYHQKSWEDESAKFILDQDRVGLMLELVAITDIEKDDEIFIDYGAKWDEAWSDYVQNWEAPSGSHDFMSVEVLNHQKELKTEKEQLTEPLGYNVMTLCWLNTQLLGYNVKSGKRKHRWEDYKVHRGHSGADDTTTLECHIDQRYKSNDARNEDGSMYVYRIYIKGRSREGEVTVFVDGLPREAIEFVNKPYTSDQHIETAFRHHISIPDDMFPSQWMDLI